MYLSYLTLDEVSPYNYFKLYKVTGVSNLPVVRENWNITKFG